MNKKERLVVILGPTAVGKTALSIELAKKMKTEIISGDSMLLYRGFDIGTAKPTLTEMQGVPHHLIDVLEPDEEFNVTRFKELAGQKIAELNKAGKVPLLAGGTGLYVKSLLEDYQFNTAGSDNAYRQELEELAAVRGREYVHAMLAQVAPQTAARLHINDFRRVIRALEVYHCGGEVLSQENKLQSAGELVYDALVVGLTMERSRLYERINKRVELMVENGLIDEVRHLLACGVPIDCQAMKGIGYKEIAAYLQGEFSLDEAVDAVQKGTRHFAKRQLTWFRKMPYIVWYDVGEMEMMDIMENIYNKAAGNCSAR